MAWTVKLLWRLLQSERLEETRGQEVKRSGLSWLTTRLSADVGVFLFLPSRCILGGNAPRQVVIAVVTARIVKEISSGGQDVVGDPRSALSTVDQSQVRKQSGGWSDFLLLLQPNIRFHVELKLYCLSLDQQPDGLS